jgi:hypothetical protein
VLHSFATFVKLASIEGSSLQAPEGYMMGGESGGGDPG